ncbi:MAG: flagellar motor switch protein FliM [Halobacteriovoraceae bacterium]|nr:flagellar motor switch protein FliM [Halobacteriovoraceae bacterium]
MAQVLSQEEVDALLNAVNYDEEDDSSDGDQSQEESENKSKSDIQEYDLTNQDRIIRGRMPILEIIYERFIRLFRVSLSNSLRKISSMSLISSDILKFGEFINTLPIPSCMCILRFNELRGPALLVFESKLAYAIIDSYFGGTDRPFTNVEGKEFTQIELSFMKKVMDMAINDLEEAWSPVHRVEAQYLRTEINPQFVGVVPPSDVVVATTLEIEFESALGTMMIVIPYSTIEPIKKKLSSSFQTDNEMVDSIWVQAMNTHIQDIKADLVVKLGETEVTIGALLNLQVGDVIMLGQESSGEVKVEIEGSEKMKGIIGLHKGNHALQVTEIKRKNKKEMKEEKEEGQEKESNDSGGNDGR